MYNETIKILDRYTEGHVSEQLDPEFAAAVQTAITELTVRELELHSAEVELAVVKRDLDDCRNELCLKCGEYRLNNCGECRWRR